MNSRKKSNRISSTYTHTSLSTRHLSSSTQHRMHEETKKKSYRPIHLRSSTSHYHTHYFGLQRQQMDPPSFQPLWGGIFIKERQWLTTKIHESLKTTKSKCFSRDVKNNKRKTTNMGNKGQKGIFCSQTTKETQGQRTWNGKNSNKRSSSQHLCKEKKKVGKQGVNHIIAHSYRQDLRKKQGKTHLKIEEQKKKARKHQTLSWEGSQRKT